MRDLTARLCWLVLLVALISVSAALPVARAQEDPAPPAYEPVAENEAFALAVDANTLAFQLLDKRSGYVWHSGIDELREGDRLNRSWQAFARSGLSIDVLDKRAASDRVSLTNSAHTLDVTPVERGISARLTFTDYGITMGLILQLEDHGLRVELPFAAIQQTNPDFRLGQVYLYPFFGATRGGSTPGYMLLPDGAGSLIRFADTTRARNMFYGRYYGPDLGMIGEQPYNPRVVDPMPISYPVFGMAHGEGENAFLSIVEQGAAYGELQAHPAGVITNFNFLYHTFIYNEPYFQATNRSGAGVTTIQPQPNAFDAVVYYRFLTGATASYTGMARDYQRYLLDRDELHPVAFTTPDIGIRLEFLGGDKEPSLFGNQFVPMTTVNQMREILAGLNLPNPEVVYYGWQPMGATTMPPGTLTLDSALGSLDDVRELTGRITADDGRFSLYLDPLGAIYNEGGYSARNDVAMAITDVSIEGYNRSYKYFFSYAPLEQRYRDLTGTVAAQPNIGLALDTVGWLVFSDFRGGQEMNREAAMDAYRSLLAQSPLPLSFYRPNDYLYGLAQAYFDMPSGDNGYIFTSEAVPFLPIVLSGYVPYYGGALNFSSDRQTDLLRQAEYGIYPSYFLTYQPTDDMINTPSLWIYSSSYTQWGEPITATYAWMNALLGPVRGQPITAHTRLGEGVSATTYANGLQVVVNYTDQPYETGGVTVAPRDAALVEARP